MTTSARNVILLSPQPPADDCSVPIARLHTAVSRFDDLRLHAERLAASPRWSAADWRTACSPLLVRFPRVRRSLADLDAIRVGRCADTQWAVRIRTFCSAAEQHMTELRASMGAAMSLGDHTRTAGHDAMRLAAALDALSTLVSSRFPADEPASE